MERKRRESRGPPTLTLDLCAMRAPRWDAQGLSAHGLLALVEAILSNLAAALTLPPTSPRAYLHLLPTALSLLGPMDHCELLAANGTTLADGAAVVAYAVAGLRSQPWAAPSLVPLATMLRDITLPEAARRELVLQLTGRFDELEPTQMPALVYQMLLLADTDSKAHVLRALNAHFAGRDSDAWMLVQGTVILHIQFAVKQDQPLGNAVLKQVKGGQMPLGAFSFALLLSLARVGERFHDAVRARERGGRRRPCSDGLGIGDWRLCLSRHSLCLATDSVSQVLQHLTGSLREAFELRAWTNASPWLSEASSSLEALRPGALLTAALRSSSSASFDHLVPSLIDLAASLLDEPPPGKARKANSGALPRDRSTTAPSAATRPPRRLYLPPRALAPPLPRRPLPPWMLSAQMLSQPAMTALPTTTPAVATPRVGGVAASATAVRAARVRARRACSQWACAWRCSAAQRSLSFFGSIRLCAPPSSTPSSIG